MGTLYFSESMVKLLENTHISLGNKKALQSVRLELLAVGLVYTSFFLVVSFLIIIFIWCSSLARDNL